VRHGCGNDVSNVLAREGVGNLPSVPLAPHHAGAAQHAQMLLDQGLRRANGVNGVNDLMDTSEPPLSSAAPRHAHHPAGRSPPAAIAHLLLVKVDSHS
jgi:hypothetical protein